MSEKMIIPGSIIIAGAIIGLAIYFSGQPATPAANPSNPTAPAAATADIKKVDAASDHITGSASAELFVVEYSDLECPFCKRYHDTVLAPLKNDYKDNEKVAFVFRHFPLDEPFTRALHPTATEEAIAVECVARLGGDANAYIDAIFATSQSNGAYPLANLSGMAVTAGADKTAFDTCFQNQDTMDVVTASFNEGSAAGVQGTPTVYIQTKGGKTFPAVPDYNALKTAIDAYLNDNS